MTIDTKPSRLIIPSFGKIYKMLEPVAYPLLRLMIGFLFVPHGMQKLFHMFGGLTFDGYQKAFAKMGEFWGAAGWVYYIGSLELIGGFCIGIGLLTRFWSFQMAIFMGVAGTVATVPKGWFYYTGGMEAGLSWMVVLIYVFVLGGGSFSVDRLIGKEI